MKKRLALGAIVVLSSLLLLKGEKAVSVRVSQKMPEKVEISNSKGTYLAKTSEVEVGKNTNLPEGFYEIRNLAKNESDHIQITRDGKNLVDGLELVAEDDIRYADTNRFLIRLKRGDRIKLLLGNSFLVAMISQLLNYLEECQLVAMKLARM